MAPSIVPSNSILRFVVNGTATERLAVLEGGRVAVRLELQVLGGATTSTREYWVGLLFPCRSLPHLPQPWVTRDDDALGDTLQ